MLDPKELYYIVLSDENGKPYREYKDVPGNCCDSIMAQINGQPNGIVFIMLPESMDKIDTSKISNVSWKKE